MRWHKQLILASCCAFLSAGLIYAYSSQLEKRYSSLQQDALERYGGEQVEVFVARRPLAQGEKVLPEALEKRSWIVDLLPPDAVTQAEDVVGKTLSSSILQGEPISLQRFEQDTSRLDVPGTLVALSLPAQAVRSVGGALAPGMLVDVYATGASGSTRMLQAASVLAVSKVSEGASLQWVTLAVEPDRVQEIIEASHKTELYFVLPGSELIDEFSKDANHE